jgi:methylenetetrahydrofolate--tRNA-(uracil-5-)-methyltransferase
MKSSRSTWSAAVWRARKRPGRSRAPVCPSSKLHEMRPVRGTEAHKTDGLAELVCSNSFRSDDAGNVNAVGPAARGDAPARLADHAYGRRQPGARRRRAGGRSRRLLRMRCTKRSRPPADRRSARGGRRAAAGRLGQRHRRDRPPHLPALAEAVRGITGEDALAFFDAIAPIVHKRHDRHVEAWFQSRYDKVGPGGTGGGLHQLPDRQGAVRRLHRRPARGEKTAFQGMGGQHPYFDGCLPIEVMAERGRETLRHGPMKPWG